VAFAATLHFPATCQTTTWLVATRPVAGHPSSGLSQAFENVNPISEHRLHSSQLGRAMNLVDRLLTSADERVLSGRRAVVIA